MSGSDVGEIEPAIGAVIGARVGDPKGVKVHDDLAPAEFRPILGEKTLLNDGNMLI